MEDTNSLEIFLDTREAQSHKASKDHRGNQRHQRMKDPDHKRDTLKAPHYRREDRLYNQWSRGIRLKEARVLDKRMMLKENPNTDEEVFPFYIQLALSPIEEVEGNFDESLCTIYSDDENDFDEFSAEPIYDEHVPENMCNISINARIPIKNLSKVSALLELLEAEDVDFFHN